MKCKPIFTDPSMFVSARGSSTADHGLRELPKFVGNVQNQTVRAGNDVILACQVKSLGNYKACIRAQIQGISIRPFPGWDIAAGKLRQMW